MEATRFFPDPEYCRILRRSNILCDCLAEDAAICPYATASNFGFFCQHPERSEFTSLEAPLAEP
ncbi:MAG: hypothetical protein NDI77_10525 [Geobacteraceae bacterium]|nr:hypothetical protein [Geobacteraceae bacterium]